MTVFEPLFLLCALALIVSLARLIYQLARGRPARILAARIAASVGLYFVVLVTVSATTPARIYRPGEPQCFDDWCLAVERIERKGGLLEVHFAAISQARRVTQREFGVRLVLVDEQNRTFEPVASFGQPIETAVGPGERFETGRTFRPARNSRGLAVVIRHGGPGLVIIADRGSLFHRRSRMLLPVPVSPRL